MHYESINQVYEISKLTIYEYSKDKTATEFAHIIYQTHKENLVCKVCINGIEDQLCSGRRNVLYNN